MRTHGRAAALLTAGLLGTGLLAVVPATAQASTVISPPTIDAPFGGLGPYTAGTQVTFTFSPSPFNAAPAAYQYTLDSDPTQTVSAPSGTASVAITIPERPADILSVVAVAADGTVSGPTVDEFTTQLATPAADKDFNGDGLPDLLTVGGTAGLPPGLWLAPGDAARPRAASRGVVEVPATNIGVNGDGTGSPESPADFDGAQVISGNFEEDNYQGFLMYFPSGPDAGGGLVVPGSGDGSPLGFSQEGVVIDQGDLADANGDNPLQVVSADQSTQGLDVPDLITVSGDQSHGFALNYFISLGAPGAYLLSFADDIPTPDGTDDWPDWTLATLSYSGGAGMFLWNESTGALYLWAGLTATDNFDGTGSLAFTQYKIASRFFTGQPLATLEAADFNHDGVPDLWAVTPSGIAIPFTVTNLSATSTARVRQGRPQRLVPASSAG